MRGKASFAIRLRSRFRITPAYAGKRIIGLFGGFVNGDHPRICGEKSCKPPRYFDKLGSPPHMRGKAYLFLGIVASHGITPAYAGKSHYRIERCCHSEDHPRICGEKQVLLAMTCRFQGSPPHMRGKAIVDAPAVDMTGITPAYAGKRSTLTRYYREIQDHPRICGEKIFWRLFLLWNWGSPPHMRGKVTKSFEEHGFIRITPAYAGKRKWNCRTTKTHGDHPRICGEKAQCPHGISVALGSPPHMRGKEFAKLTVLREIRITPAYAGKSKAEIRV